MEVGKGGNKRGEGVRDLKSGKYSNKYKTQNLVLNSRV